MARILLELTNRCNLRCRHCYDERHAASGQMDSSVIETVLREGRDCGIHEVVFTGGEPTLHPRFRDIVARCADGGYGYGFVTNGITFPRIHRTLLEHRDRLSGVTFSLDGASAATHDRLRGTGSFRRVLKAATICVFRDLPFSINMVITAENRHEIAQAIDLAASIGSCGLRFGHLITSDGSPRPGLELSLAERREVEAEIATLAARAPLPVAMGPGYYDAAEPFPCAPLNRQEYNVDYRGNVTLCCQISGVDGVNGGDDVLGNLHDISLAEACRRFEERVARYRLDKRRAAERGQLADADHCACLYCLKYLGKREPQPMAVQTVPLVRLVARESQ